MLLNCGVGEDSWESLGLQGDPTSHPKGNQSWIFIGRTDAEAETPNTLATWCKQLTHWKRPWCWERLKAGGEGVNRGRDGWMASPTWWTWVWVSSRSWWWTGKHGMLQSMRLERVGHDWATELNWRNGRWQIKNLFQGTFFAKRRASGIGRFELFLKGCTYDVYMSGSRCQQRGSNRRQNSRVNSPKRQEDKEFTA